MSKQKASLVALLLYLLMACTPYSPPRVYPPAAEFAGFMEYQNTTVIMMHGMCHHGEEWINKSLAEFNEHLKVAGAAPLPVWESKESNGVKLYKTVLTGQNRNIQFYAIVFSEVTRPIKKMALCANVSSKTASCDTETPAYDRTQAKANKILKNKLMNECLSDAVIYLGKTGKEIREGVRGAIAFAADDTQKQTAYKYAPTVLIAESLGSKILTDSIFCESGKDMRLVDKNLVTKKEVVDELIARQMATTTQVFLLANQIPLLNLGFESESCEVPSGVRSYRGTMERLGTFQAFIEWINANKQPLRSIEGMDARAGEDAHVVAFTDPNDVLSYELSEKDLNVKLLTNIVVSNDLTWVGLLENPYTAHTTYSGNDYVVKYIGCGKARNSREAKKCPGENSTGE